MNERLKLRQGDILSTKEKCYIIGQEIGKGANGIVYKVRGKKKLAIKIFSPRESTNVGEMNNLCNRFKNEIIKLKYIYHWNIVEIKDWGEYKYKKRKIPFFVMELVHTSLRYLLVNEMLSLVKQFYFCAQLCEAFNYIHNRGFIHRDIKPENILVSSTDLIKVSDLGIAEIISNIEDINFYTETDNDRPAPRYYISPEQLRYKFNNLVTLDQRSDIYQLGKVFYEIFTGVNLIGQIDSFTGSKFLFLKYLTQGFSESYRPISFFPLMLQDNRDMRPDCLFPLIIYFYNAMISALSDSYKIMNTLSSKGKEVLARVFNKSYCISQKKLENLCEKESSLKDGFLELGNSRLIDWNVPQTTINTSYTNDGVVTQIQLDASEAKELGRILTPLGIDVLNHIKLGKKYMEIEDKWSSIYWKSRKNPNIFSTFQIGVFNYGVLEPEKKYGYYWTMLLRNLQLYHLIRSKTKKQGIKEIKNYIKRLEKSNKLQS